MSVKQNVSKLIASLLFRFANITVGTGPSEEVEEKPEVSIWRIYTVACNVFSIMNWADIYIQNAKGMLTFPKLNSEKSDRNMSCCQLWRSGQRFQWFPREQEGYFNLFWWKPCMSVGFSFLFITLKWEQTEMAFLLLSICVHTHSKMDLKNATQPQCL